jgi:hypothetical protein
MVSSQVAILEDDLSSAREQLAAEKAAGSSERQRAAALGSDLAALQAAAASAAATAAVDRTELQRLRGQVGCDRLTWEAGAGRGVCGRPQMRVWSRGGASRLRSPSPFRPQAEIAASAAESAQARLPADGVY